MTTIQIYDKSQVDALIAGAGSGLPDSTSASAGDVLTLDSNKDPEWSTPATPSAGITAHTYSTLGAFVSDYIAHPLAICKATFVGGGYRWHAYLNLIRTNLSGVTYTGELRTSFMARDINASTIQLVDICRDIMVDNTETSRGFYGYSKTQSSGTTTVNSLTGETQPCLTLNVSDVVLYY